MDTSSTYQLETNGFKQVWANARNTQGQATEPKQPAAALQWGKEAGTRTPTPPLSIDEAASTVFGLQDKQAKATPFQSWFIKNNLDLNNNGQVETNTELPLFMQTLAQEANSDSYLTQQRSTYLSQLADYAGLSPSEKNLLQQRLASGRYAVAGETPQETFNTLQQAQTNPNDLSQLAGLATQTVDELQNASPVELKTSLTVLANSGFLPNWLGENNSSRQAKQGFRFYQTQVGATDTKGVTQFNLQQVDVSPGAGGRAVFSGSQVAPQAIVQGAPALYLKDPASYGQQPLPNQQQLWQALANTVPAVAQQFGGVTAMAATVVNALNNPTQLQQTLNPLVAKLEEVYGVQGVKFAIAPATQGDNPGLFGGYQNGQITLYQTALKGAYQQSLNMGLSPQQAAIDLLAVVTNVTTHELGHAFQDAAQQNPQRYGYTSTTPRVQDYAENKKVYNPSVFSNLLTGNPKYYLEQALEKDAWALGGVTSNAVWQASGVAQPQTTVSKQLYEGNPFATYQWV